MAESWVYVKLRHGESAWRMRMSLARELEAAGFVQIVREPIESTTIEPPEHAVMPRPRKRLNA